MAKLNLKEATKPLYAGVGVTDLAVEVVRDYVTAAQERFTVVQKNVQQIDLEPQALPAKLQALLDENVTAAGDTYGNLVSRGEGLVTRIRRQQTTQAATASAKTTSAKAKTAGTQAKKATKSTTKTATSTAAKKSAPAKSSAKATGTAAKKTASSASQATTEAAKKVGD